MRTTLLLVACLSMTACVSAQFTAGELGEDDILVSRRLIFKPPIPFIPMIARLGGSAPPCHVISYVSVVDLGAATSSSNLIRGAIGTDEVFVMTRGKAGQGLNIEFSVYATNVCPTTTEPDPSTPDVAATDPDTSTPDVTATEPDTSTPDLTTSHTVPPSTGTPIHPPTPEVPTSKVPTPEVPTTDGPGTAGTGTDLPSPPEPTATPPSPDDPEPAPPSSEE